MENINKEQQSIIPTQLVSLGDFLPNLIDVLPNPAHIKDAKTGKYILSNSANLVIYGLQSVNDILGKTVQDLDIGMKNNWGCTFASTVDKFDYQVKTYKQQISDKRIILTSSGFIHLQNMIKTPVLGSDNKVTAIFTFSQNLTPQIEHVQLFNLYKQRYSKKMAIKQFLKHLKINKFFTEDPTEAELLVLLAMRHEESYKHVAGSLGIGYKTVEIHSSRLRSKLKENIQKLLIYMRNELKVDPNENTTSS